CSSWSVITTDVTKGLSTTFRTGVSKVMDWAFGGVLEAYGVGACSEFPASNSITFDVLSLWSVESGSQTEAPQWTGAVLGGTPDCHYGVSSPTTAQVTVTWNAAGGGSGASSGGGGSGAGAGGAPGCPGLVEGGLYCGNDGIQGGSANTLYRCSSGRALVVQACPSGCQVMPPRTHHRRAPIGGAGGPGRRAPSP